MQVHPLYLKELRSRNDPNILSKSTLEHYLKLDPTMYIDYVRKRFSDGSNNWCYKMKYSKLGIDMIRVVENAGETKESIDKRVVEAYTKMGVNITPEPPKATNPDDLPF